MASKVGVPCWFAIRSLRVVMVGSGVTSFDGCIYASFSLEAKWYLIDSGRNLRQKKPPVGAMTGGYGVVVLKTRKTYMKHQA
jgi:hypothetical protein